MALSGNQPARQNNSEEVKGDQDPALLSALDLHGMQVHVELRTDVTVQNRVDILEAHSSLLNVRSVRKRVWLVEVAPSGDSEGGVLVSWLMSECGPDQK